MTGGVAVEVLRSADELAAARERCHDRRALELLLCARFEGQESWTLPGVCQACDEAVELYGDWQYSDGRAINFRERLVCPRCGLNNRQRFMARLLRDEPGDGPLYLYEQVTPFYAWAQGNLTRSTVGSEYLGYGIAGGTEIDGVRHEDALALSFGDESFDTIVSNDVFEHVPDIDRSLEECARVLRPGGRLLFSVPFHETPSTRQRAELRDGEVVELLPAEFHGNPVDPQGSLVFYDHGWDLLDRCRAAGFADACVLGYWSLLYGYLGAGLQLVFSAERS